MGQPDYLSVPQIARALGKSRQAVWKAVKRGTWAGNRLAVREVNGIGGAGGKTIEVLFVSLPRDVQERWKALQRPTQLALPLAEGTDSKELAWKLHYVEPLSQLPTGAQRKRAIMELHNREVHDWRGGLTTLKRTTLYKWVTAYTAEGIAGLMRGARSDRGTTRVHVSRKWDNAVPFDEATKELIGRMLADHIKGLWKAGCKPREVRELAQDFLAKQTEELGHLANDQTIFALSDRKLEKDRHYAKVHRHRSDRKASEDARWYQRRDSSKLVPMEVVMGDVHHLNTPLTLPNGKVVYPKIISFVDVATLRMRSTVIVCETAGAVRVTDMIAAYMAMVTDPAWGIPRTLYLDNGKENGFAPFMQDAARLAWRDANGNEQRTLVHATKYNARAKAQVEARFAQIENHFLQFMQGWSGDQRHNPKVPALGKRHEPWSDGVEAYFQRLHKWEHVDNTIPRRKGHLAGQSPEERFGRFVAEGWQAVVASEEGFNMAFCTRELVRVRGNKITRGRREWSCDGLKAYHKGQAYIYLPKYHGYNALAVEDLDGTPLGIATPDEPVDFLDPRGAIDSINARKLYLAGLRELDRSSPNLDPDALLGQRAEARPPAEPNPPSAVVRVAMHDAQPLAIRPRRAAPEEDAAGRETQRLREHEAYIKLLGS